MHQAHHWHFPLLPSAPLPLLTEAAPDALALTAHSALSLPAACELQPLPRVPDCEAWKQSSCPNSPEPARSGFRAGATQPSPPSPEDSLEQPSCASNWKRKVQRKISVTFRKTSHLSVPKPKFPSCRTLASLSVTAQAFLVLWLGREAAEIRSISGAVAPSPSAAGPASLDLFLPGLIKCT